MIIFEKKCVTQYAQAPEFVKVHHDDKHDRAPMAADEKGTVSQLSLIPDPYASWTNQPLRRQTAEYYQSVVLL